jgi:hypothetical protein
MTAPTSIQTPVVATVFTNSTAAPVFGSAVTAGNILVQFTFGPTSTAIAFPGVGSNGWTRVGGYQDTLPSYGMTVEIWTRTALGGDGTTPPVVQSNYNSGRNYSIMWELSSNATFDADAFGFVVGAGGTTGTNLTTGAANTLCLGSCAADFNEYSSIATTGGWTVDTSAGPYGVEQTVVSSGTTLSMVIGASGFSDTVYGMISFDSGAGPPPPPSQGGPSFWGF